MNFSTLKTDSESTRSTGGKDNQTVAVIGSPSSSLIIRARLIAFTYAFADATTMSVSEPRPEYVDPS